MHDRFVHGYLSGAIGGAVMAFMQYIFYKLGISESRFLDLTAIIFSGQIPHTIFGEIVAQIVQTGHAAIMGIFFAYFINWFLNRQYIAFKGATFGVMIWFLIFSLGALFKIPLYTNNTPSTVFSYIISSSIWGVVTGSVLVWLEKSSGISETQRSFLSGRVIAQPAYKRNSDENNDDL